MEYYVKNINEETGVCGTVGLGTDVQFYKSQGMELRDITQYEDGVWYLTEKLPPISKEKLAQFLYEKKCGIAYGGVIIVKDDKEYLFQTGQDSITMCNSQAIAFSTMEETATVDWKVYQNEFPILLTLTKLQFLQVFSFGMQMINSAFAVEGSLNKEVNNMTQEQRKDQTFIQNFKTTAQETFNKINRKFIITTLNS